MANKRYDACTPRPKHNQDGTWWHRVGSAFENDKGQITIYLDSVPVPDKTRGSIVICLFEPREKDTATAPRGKARPRTEEFSDDEIPF